MFGIDVSTYQGVIDFRTVKASGVAFIMIKATQGRGEGPATRYLRKFTDGKFKRNAEGAYRQGIPFGVYHYLTAKSPEEAVYEAEYFCRVIAPYKTKMSLWAAVDVESGRYLGALDKEALAAVVNTFCTVVREHGFMPMVYTNPDYLKHRLPEGALDAYPIWLAHWNVTVPYAVKNRRIWQYGVGTVAGIRGQTDVCRGTFTLPLSPETEGERYAVGGTYTIRSGDRYTTGQRVPARLVGRTFTVSAVSDGKLLLKEIYSWVKTDT